MASDLQKRKKEWLEKLKREGKLRDPTEDHRIGLRALQHRVRREIIKFIGYGKRSFEEIAEKFNLSEAQARMHLDLLEEALFVESRVENGKKYYYLTPRGEAYLENVEWR